MNPVLLFEISTPRPLEGDDGGGKGGEVFKDTY